MANLILSMKCINMKWRVYIFPVLFIVPMLLVLMACDDSSSTYIATPKLDTLMPPYTDTGGNVFAFRINGRLVIAEDRIQRTSGISMSYFKPDDESDPVFFVESAYKSKTRYEGIRLSVANVVDTGFYYLKESTETNSNQGQYLIGETSYLTKAFTTRDNRTGYVHIMKIDTINHVIAGKFSFKAELFLLGDDVVSVTDGQFDAEYYH